MGNAPATPMSETHPPFTLAIVGAGASGALLAIQALRKARAGQSICLIGPDPRAGTGVAYGTEDPSHFLNVPAEKMSALPSEPDQFSRWLTKAGAPGAGYASRASFARYLGE